MRMTAEEFKNKVIPFSVKLYPMLFGILKNEEETRDALQDLMLKLWNKRGELLQCTNLSAYVITIARNHSFDLLKKQRPILVDESDLKLFRLEATEPDAEKREKLELVHKTIENMPEKYREIIRYRDIDGFSFDEIKELTGLEIPNIRVILSRARIKVKEEIEKVYSYESGRTA
jgi:RNA polymerase sigma-70 factor (ECF subfamily)